MIDLLLIDCNVEPEEHWTRRGEIGFRGDVLTDPCAFPLYFRRLWMHGVRLQRVACLLF